MHHRLSIFLVIHGLWWTVSGQVKAYIVLTCIHKWGLTQSPSCDCGQQQILKVDDDTVIWHCRCYSHVGASRRHDYAHPFNGPLSSNTQVSRYQKGKTNLDFTEARDSEWQWHQLGRMQVCISLQTDNHASTPPLSFFTDRMPFLTPNQQRQSTEGIIS